MHHSEVTDRTFGPVSPDEPSRARSALVLAGILLAFLVVRVPIMYHQPGGQDEDYFAVAGWTTSQEGSPRIPYCPARNKESVFYRADEILLTLPPAYFYWQVPFFRLLPAEYGTARLASGIAGVAAIAMVYLIAQMLYASRVAGLWAAVLYSLSRLFYFPAIFARPDMLCAAFGLGALLAACFWHRRGQLRWALAAGALLGLGGLTHPFALVFAIQLGGWMLLAGRGLRHRIASLAVLTGAALVVFSLWLPLIAEAPDIFRVQFFNNVLDRSGPGLVQRLLWPWDAVRAQSGFVYKYSGPIQMLIVGGGLIAVTLIDGRRPRSGAFLALLLAWSSVYLLTACQGEHENQHYWCYPAALVFVCLGRLAQLAWQAGQRRAGGSLWKWSAGVLLVLLMLPGSGVRTWVTYVQHGSDPQYDASQFARQLIHDLPADARYLVSPEYVFDFYLAGRDTTYVMFDELYFDAEGVPYDYLVAGRLALARGYPERLGAKYVRSYGRADDIFACYAEVYQAPARKPKPASPDTPDPTPGL